MKSCKKKIKTRAQESIIFYSRRRPILATKMIISIKSTTSMIDSVIVEPDDHDVVCAGGCGNVSGVGDDDDGGGGVGGGIVNCDKKSTHVIVAFTH